jgi:hypothetical protein
MIHTLWAISPSIRDFLTRWMPTNRLLAAIRSRRGLKWGLPAMGLALPYLVIASACTTALARGGPGWLNLVVLWAIWDAFKFVVIGPVALAALVKARWRERRAARAFHTGQGEGWLEGPA